MQRLKAILKSKTVWGTAFASGAWLFSQPHIGVVEVFQAVGPILAAAGVKDSFTKLVQQ